MLYWGCLCCSDKYQERRVGEMLPREDGFQWRSRRYIKKEKAEEGKNVKDPLERRGGRKGNWYLLRLLPR